MPIKLAATKITRDICPCSMQQPKSPGILAHAACSNQNHLGNWPVQLAAIKITWEIGLCSLQHEKSLEL
jgi:hypothetical protein